MLSPHPGRTQFSPRGSPDSAKPVAVANRLSSRSEVQARKSVIGLDAGLVGSPKCLTEIDENQPVLLKADCRFVIKARALSAFLRKSVNLETRMKNALVFSTMLALVLGAAGTVDANLLTNGDFQTGSLAPWTAFTTGNGTNGAGFPNVVSFDTTGSGASLAAQFQVGEVTFTGAQEGGGIFQSLTLAGGTY